MKFLYDSFTTKTGSGRFSDSPKAIYRLLQERLPDANHLWTASDRLGFPDNLETFAPGTDSYYEMLSGIDLLVGNAFSKDAVRRRKGAFYLQTWHGTPLKRIALDEPNNDQAQIDLLLSRTREFDALISPNAFCTEVFRSAFAYEGDIWEVGYPRNDLLNAPDRDDVRKRVRNQLGVSDDQTVTLYAPTWRDNIVDSEGHRDVELALDLNQLAEQLGPDHVILTRLHYFIASRLQVTSDQVRDVSDYPDISELYLAADTLVTDYSSVMFDFAVTGKPIVFFVYDYTDFKNDVRGFYFDLEEEAPGPLVHDSTELLAALQDLSSLTTRHRNRYQDFRAKFCHHDDGHATERVVQRLLAAIEL